MKQKINLHQQSAEKMRSNILQTAQKVFIQNGFSGASIGAIAKQANINQSLIYHYFSSKEELWREVKKHMISLTGGTVVDSILQVKTLDQLLEHLLIKRSELYQKNPDLIRMLLWQMLEENGDMLSGTSQEWVNACLQVIETLQKQNQINSKFTPKEVFLWINGVIWAPFLTGFSNHETSTYCQKMLNHIKLTLK